MKKNSFTRNVFKTSPRLPLEGFLDITYRCNNNCRHCWLYTTDSNATAEKEVSFTEIQGIVEQARAMGCRTWAISGGEPMLREDFLDILELISAHSSYYSLNTNGTRITPEIAKALKKKGNKWVALYGATAEIHDHITRRPGSHEEALRGMAYLKEAGAGFTVHIVPMRDNYHQLQDMIALAESHDYEWRNGKAWLYLSAAGDPRKNREIAGQRLSAEQLVTLEDVDIPEYRYQSKKPGSAKLSPSPDLRLFKGCADSRKDFHIDPYGCMSFCNMVKDPRFRYDLGQGSFAEAWDSFLPGLSGQVIAGKEFFDNCGGCDLRQHCSWCPAYAYLECGSYQAKIPSLCEHAAQTKNMRAKKTKEHQRFYQLGGLTIQVQSAFPITAKSFDSRFETFVIDPPDNIDEDELVVIKHHRGLPIIDWNDPGEPVYVHRPWAIYQKNDALIYCHDVDPTDRPLSPSRIAVVNREHTRINIYHHHPRFFANTYSALSMFPTDVILLGQTFAHKQAFWLHSSGVIMDGRGFLFVGPSGAGKSTMVKLLRDEALIMCDERNIIRRWPEGFRVHGTWSHGELPEVHPYSAPLRGIFFLEQSSENRAVVLTDKVVAHKKMMQCLIRPVQTSEWWASTMDLLGKVLDEVPIYTLYFARDKRVKKLLKTLY